MFFIFLILFLLFAGGIAFSNLLYWYESTNEPSEDVPALQLTAYNCLRLWACTAWGLIIGVLVRPFSLVQKYWDKPLTPLLPGQDGPPLLMLHGLYHDNSAWILMRRHLHKAGFSRVHMLHYPAVRSKLEDLPQYLEKAVAELEQLYPGEKPLLVGHSLGGLVIRAWMAQDGNQTRAAGVLTLGTPHRGSKVGAMAIGSLGRSLIPSCPFFAELAKREQPAAIPCVALATQGDTMVLPLQDLVPVTPNWEFRLTSLTSHLGMLFSPAVHRMVAWELHRMAAINAAASAEKTKK